MNRLLYVMLFVSLLNVSLILQRNNQNTSILQKKTLTKAEEVRRSEKDRQIDSISNFYRYSRVDRTHSVSNMPADSDDENINDDSDQKLIMDQQADMSLSAHILQILSNDLQLSEKAANIKVAAVDGSVIVYGVAQSEEDRKVIIRQIDSVAGVEAIDDHLRIASK